jgi:hypothetical protein
MLNLQHNLNMQIILWHYLLVFMGAERRVAGVRGSLVIEAENCAHPTNLHSNS